MWARLSWLVLVGLLGVGCSGCLVMYDGKKVLRRNEARDKVEFESEEAAQLFQEKFEQEKCACMNRSRGRESMVIPVIAAVNVKTKLSENACYNDAVRACDSDGDECITEAEARVYHQRASEENPCDCGC